MCTGVAHGEVDDVVAIVELAHQLHAVAFVHPGRHLAAVQAEGDGAVQGKGVVLAEEVVRRGVRALHGAFLHAVHHTEGGHELATGVHRDAELAAGHFTDLLGKHVGCAVDGVQRLGEAGSQTPADGGLRMNSGGGSCGQHTGNACVLDEGTTIHID